jgi:Domain of unknown function (DUF3516)
MKAEGIEYEQRMELLEDIDHPKPLADLIEVAYDAYRKGHPWIAEYQPEPKSVVRDMYERAMTFSEYIAFYGLARSEGVVLRYFADAYRALRRTVPTTARTDELTDITSWLGELVRGVDSSLLDEWEALAHPDVDELILPGSSGEIRPPIAARGVTANERGFTVMVRNALFRRVELLAREDYAALGELHAAQGWRADSWESALHGYWNEYDMLGIGPNARSAALVVIDRTTEKWHVRQVFDDPAGDHDWGLSVEVGLAASDEAGEPVLTILDLGPATG